MVILFSQKKKKDLYFLGLAVVLSIGLILFWVFYLNQATTNYVPEQEDVVKIKEERVQIDFTALQNQLLKDLRPFEFIAATTTKSFGRANPFEPLQSTSTEPNL